MASKYLLKTEVDLETGDLFEQIVDKLKIKKTELVKKMIWSEAHAQKIITKEEKDRRAVR